MAACKSLGRTFHPILETLDDVVRGFLTTERGDWHLTEGLRHVMLALGGDKWFDSLCGWSVIDVLAGETYDNVASVAKALDYSRLR